MLPLIVQPPVAAKLTDKLELAVAITVKSESPRVLPTSAPNEIDWLALLTVSVPVALLLE